MLGEQASRDTGRVFRKGRGDKSYETDFYGTSGRESLPTYFTWAKKEEHKFGFLIFIHPDSLPLKTHNNIFVGIWSKRQCRKTAQGQAQITSSPLHFIPPENWPKQLLKIFIPTEGKHVPLKNYSLQDCIFHLLLLSRQLLCPHSALVQMVTWTAILIARKISAASRSSKAILASFLGFRVWDEANNLQVNIWPSAYWSSFWIHAFWDSPPVIYSYKNSALSLHRRPDHSSNNKQKQPAFSPFPQQMETFQTELLLAICYCHLPFICSKMTHLCQIPSS